jgi:hypothetical protein
MHLCCLHNYWYYELIRLLLCKITISSPDLYVSSLQLSLCKGRSLQFRTMLSVHVAPIIPEDSLMVQFKFFPSSMVFAFRGKARLPLFHLTIRQDSLYVTTCTFARILSNTLSPHFTHIISYMHSG